VRARARCSRRGQLCRSQGSFLGLLTKHISVIREDGAHVTIPPLDSGGPWLHNITGSKLVVDDFVANEAVLDFLPRDPGKSGMRFEVHEDSWLAPAPDRLKVYARADAAHSGKGTIARSLVPGSAASISNPSFSCLTAR
jgi:hypothetical protein